LAVLVALRIVAIALPGALVFAATNLTALADSLTQIARLPSRFVAGALSSLRMMSLLADDWRTMGYARRARGLSTRGPRQFAGQSFALFVRAVRRGSALATTMEARGFGGQNQRSWSRVSVWRARDWLIVAGGCLIAALVVGISVATGSWQVVVFG
jgi:energy-coupling factor transport system permease protein